MIYTLTKESESELADLVLSNMVVPNPADEAMRDVRRHMQVLSLDKILAFRGSATLAGAPSYTCVVFAASSSFKPVDGSIALRVF